MAHYRRNFLTRVLLRVDLEPIAGLQGAQQAGSPIAEELGHDYRVVTASPMGTLIVNMSPLESGVQQQLTGLAWEHRKAANGTQLVSVSSEHLFLQYGPNDFDHFPPFREEFTS